MNRPDTFVSWLCGLPLDPGEPRWFFDANKQFTDPEALFVGRLLNERNGEWWVERMVGPHLNMGGHRFPYEPLRFLWTQGPALKPPSRWSPKRPVPLGPYWVFDMNRPCGADTKPFAAWVSHRSPGEHGLTLRTVEGHLLRPDEERYWWHPWQEEMPEVPPEALEPEAGTWSNRPWRAGVHRVASVGTTRTVDLLVTATTADWREWFVLHGKIGLGRTVGDVFVALGEDARWFRYPEPKEAP